MQPVAYYPSDAADYFLHVWCRINYTGTHRGNRYCLDHKIIVKDPADCQDSPHRNPALDRSLSKY